MMLRRNTLPNVAPMKARAEAQRRTENRLLSSASLRENPVVSFPAVSGRQSTSGRRV